MLGSKSNRRGRTLLRTIILDAAAFSIGIPLSAACSSTAQHAAGSSEPCAVQPDASIIGNGPSEVFASLVGPASACPTTDAAPFPDMLPPDLCTKLCPPPAADGGSLVWDGCGVLDVAPGSAIVLTRDGGNAAPGGYLECCFGPGCFTGRRPEGLTIEASSGDDDVGRYLASVAYLEAASVHAFERLTRELTMHGAPPSLREASRRAEHDERRHAATMRELAARHGVAVPPVKSGPRGVRSLEGIAVENAVEGCVRETFGAAAAIIQARRAADPDVRRAMSSIARDETRHATLAWDLTRWLDTRLRAGARARVAARRRVAIRDLAREATIDPPTAVRLRLGVPSATEGRRLLDALDQMLWS